MVQNQICARFTPTARNHIDSLPEITFNGAHVQTPPKMKVLFDHHLPFALAHGGFERQLVQTMLALKQAGVETDCVRWWDDAQRGDLIHFAGRPATDYITFAQGRGCRVVVAELLTATGSRSRGELALQKMAISVFRKILPGTFSLRMAWDSYRLADACIANTAWEAHLMRYLFGAPKERVHVVPNGVEGIFLNSAPAARGQWLVCTATLTERKRVLELAEAAVRARTPLWIIGKPYSDSDPYAQKIFALAKQQPQILRCEGAISDRARLAQIYREARGFVLLSAMETRSLSAEEAAACECPLLLGDLPWAHSVYGAQYCPLTGIAGTATALRKFYDVAPALPPPPRPATWQNVAEQLKPVYEKVLAA